MNVKELIQSLDFRAIAEALSKKNVDSLRPLSEYKENYDIICNTQFSGKAGSISFKADGNSDVYMIEGARFADIIGMDVVLPDSSAATKAEAAAEILWYSAPFGRTTSAEWEALFEELVNPPEADYYALQAKRTEIMIALPYCRDRSIRRELKQELKSPYEDICLSAKASGWFVSGKWNRRNRKLNRTKRKREHRLMKRYAELMRLKEAHNSLDILNTMIGTVPLQIKNLILTSSSVETTCYQSHTYGKSDRVAYIADLLLNPLYGNVNKSDSEDNAEYIGVLFSSPQNPCTIDERNRLESVLADRFNSAGLHLFFSQDNSLADDIELEVFRVTS